jgi:uncharacterized protein YecA (UPF0149 family)
MAAHRWVGMAFFDLTDDQAAEVRSLGTSVTAGTPRDNQLVDCVVCARRWTPELAAAGCAGAIGRNDPCPCGSGSKWKKCHGDGS